MNADERPQRAIVFVVDDSAETVGMLADALESNGMSALERYPNRLNRLGIPKSIYF